MRLLIFLLAILVASPASTQILLGRATAADGDTIVFGNEMIRLHGIDALEANQICVRDDEEWACGSAATDLMQTLLSKGTLECQLIARDDYNRSISRCSVAGKDLGSEMVKAGLALALAEQAPTYANAEEDARSRLVGMWAWEFEPPSEFRTTSANFKELKPPPRAERSERVPRVAPSNNRPKRTYFRNCREAWRAGAAPIYRGEPGYRPELDGDNDGIACEPFRRRRR